MTKRENHPGMFATLIPNHFMSFKEYRDANKISGAAPFFFVFKSCVGLGIFSYPYAMGKVGAIWGTILSILMNYYCTYGMYCLTLVTIDVDKRLKGMKEMSDYNSKLLLIFQNIYSI